MTTTTRRPGRPKGSRNRPKPPGGDGLQVFVRPDGPPPPVPPPPPQEVWEDPAVIRPAIKVFVRVGVAMSKAGQAIELWWPAGMPFPQTGDRIVLAGDVGGYVRSIEYHPGKRHIIYTVA